MPKHIDDQGFPGVYVGPALQNFRAFRIWVPQTSAMRVSATVWWFFPPYMQDDSLIRLQDTTVSYPPSRHRPHPKANGSDLLGRCFFDEDLGVCCITRLGPVKEKRMQSRAMRSAPNPDTPIPLGSHHTLYYKCVASGEENYSSLNEILEWIRTGPILQAPKDPVASSPNVTSPPYHHSPGNPDRQSSSLHQSRRRTKRPYRIPSSKTHPLCYISDQKASKTAR